MPPIPVAPDVRSLRDAVAGWRRAGERVALVPTLGALHEGHLSLVRLGREHADRVVVSIFVNPTQFAPSEDFAAYPRTFAEDRARLAGHADLVFAPALEEMYAPGSATVVVPGGPASAGLEDRFRPTHFQGVATVVAKLLLQCGANVAVFGEKDYQQLKVVTRMAADLFIPTRIVPAPTLREADGLAMSSRNRYLSAGARETAAELYRVLDGTATAIRSGRDVTPALNAGRARLTEAGFVLDYLDARDAETLAPAEAADRPLRLLAAARLGSTRLIDNVAV